MAAEDEVFEPYPSHPMIQKNQSPDAVPEPRKGDMIS